MKRMMVHILLFFVLMGLNGQMLGMRLNDDYCRAWGEPHIQTWSKSVTSNSGYCLVPGWHNLMNNTWISFRINITNGYTVQATIDFRNQTLNSICNVQWIHNFVREDTAPLCAMHGINVGESMRNGSLTSTTIHYNKSGITIIVTDDSSSYNRHLNINIWKPSNQTATGLCTNNQCNNHGARSISSLPSFKISKELATVICQDYLDGYLQTLSFKPAQRTHEYNKTIQMFEEACVFDVAVTGQPDAATSAIQMLMVEELTRDSADARSIAQQFQTGFRKTAGLYDQAKSEARAKIARKRILQ